MAVTTVFFDVGGTLVYVDGAIMHIWSNAVRPHGVEVDRAALEEAHKAVTEGMRTELYDSVGHMMEFWHKFDGEILRRLGVPDPDGAIAAGIVKAFHDFDGFHIFPDSVPTLEALRDRGYRLGVISNATVEVRENLDRLGLTPYFDHITFSQEARSEKPDAEVFRLAMKRHGCQPEEAVHIGDLYEADVVGARGVGIAPILIDRDDAHPDADCPRVRTLLDVEALVPDDAKS